MIDGAQSLFADRAGPTTVRPAIPLDQYLAFGVIMTGVMVAAAAVLSALTADPDKSGFVGAVVSVIIFFLLAGVRLVLVTRCSYLRIHGESLVFVNAVGLSRRIPRARVARIYQASVLVAIRGTYTFSYFLFQDASGRTLFKLPAKWWPEERIEAFGKAAGIEVNGTWIVLDGPAFRRAFPGSISWPAAHPLISACLIGFAVFALLIVALIVYGLIDGTL